MLPALGEDALAPVALDDAAVADDAIFPPIPDAVKPAPEKALPPPPAGRPRKTEPLHTRPVEMPFIPSARATFAWSSTTLHA